MITLAGVIHVVVGFRSVRKKLITSLCVHSQYDSWIRQLSCDIAIGPRMGPGDRKDY